jgi:protein arginine kinase activator
MALRRGLRIANYLAKRANSGKTPSSPAGGEIVPDWGSAAMKCQKCTKAATLHITEVLGEEQFDELHLCQECAEKYLYEPPQKGAGPKGGIPAMEVEDDPTAPNRECPICGLKFVEFRNTGRLGCPHDYQEFREQLTPLLENIHGETRHRGKSPRRLPQNKQTQSELVQLRKDLLQAVNKEAYEEAARLRDRIRQLEEC